MNDTTHVSPFALLSAAEAAAVLGVSRRVIYELGRTRRLTLTRIGRRVRVQHSDLIAFVERGRQEGR